MQSYFSHWNSLSISSKCSSFAWQLDF